MNKFLFSIFLIAAIVTLSFYWQQDSHDVPQVLSLNCKTSGTDCDHTATQQFTAEKNKHGINIETTKVNHTNYAVDDPQEKLLDSLVEQNYDIVFSYLILSAETQQLLRNLLRERERTAAEPYYDAQSNEAEVAGNLREREAAIAAIDKEIETLLGTEDAHTFNLLKDSGYEQAQLNQLDELLGEQNPISTNNKKILLLGMLEKKQQFNNLINQADAEIENAAAATKPFLMKNLQQKLLDAQKAYLLSAQAKLDTTQFDLLNADEQQEFNERWRVLSSHWE